MKIQNTITSAELLYAREHIYEKSWYSNVHSHSYTELFLITLGEGIFSIAGNRILAKCGDFLIINSNVPHTELNHQQNDLGYIVLGIKDVEFIFEDKDNRDFFVSKEPALIKRLTPIFNEIVKQTNTTDRYAEELCQSLMQTALCYLLRSIGSSISLSDTTHTISKECVAVKRYIDTHFKEDITLDILSEKAHINKYYLVHSFKDAYGISPIYYLQFRKIAESRQLLIETDMSISQIAHAMGFSSQSSFTQCFKRMLHITPTQFRKSAKEI